jgi:poly(3-hydroxybutyrate) depolymerase
MPRPLFAFLLALAIAAAGATHASAAVEALPELNIDREEISLSGLSAGAFMAVQFQVAHASLVKGAGAIAGGPYWCAQGSTTRATTRCSCTGLFACAIDGASTEVDKLDAALRRFAAAGVIDDPAKLARQRLYLFAGGRDEKVPPVIVQQTSEFFGRFMPLDHIRLDEAPTAGHNFPTQDHGTACDKSEAPYLGRCGIDTAGRLLEWIYGPLNRPVPATPSGEAPTPDRGSAPTTASGNSAPRGGRLLRFDQNPFNSSLMHWLSGLADTGWLYVPSDCNSARPGKACRLHVALHGCQQGDNGRQDVAPAFVAHAGYNEWAERNRIVVLYPQAASVPMLNPKSCWDWWGYTGNGYATREGVQIKALRQMIERLSGPAAKGPPAE